MAIINYFYFDSDIENPGDPVAEGYVKEGDVAMSDNIIFEEDLPLKYVFYPKGREPFIGFSNSRNEPPKFCECMKSSIYSYINNEIKELRNEIKENAKNDLFEPTYFSLSCEGFPFATRKYLYSQFLLDKTNFNPLSFINFEKNICHLCNKKIPKLRYRNNNYGDSFKQIFGWYIAQVRLEKMVRHYIYPLIPIKDYAEDLQEIINQVSELEGRDLMSEAENSYRALKKLDRIVSNYFEDIIRVRMGYKKIGKAWVTETTLYYMIKNLFPNLTVISHYRPRYLQGLELDIFIKELNTAIEYQGYQHYNPVKYWGGEGSLKKNKERDQRKLELCKKYGTKLVYFTYKDNITEEFVKLKMQDNTHGEVVGGIWELNSPSPYNHSFSHSNIRVMLYLLLVP